MKANNTNGAPGAEDCNKGNEHKECEGMIVDMVAAEKENSFQVWLSSFMNFPTKFLRKKSTSDIYFFNSMISEMILEQVYW